jgi:hypothetical protein
MTMAVCHMYNTKEKLERLEKVRAEKLKAGPRQATEFAKTSIHMAKIRARLCRCKSDDPVYKAIVLCLLRAIHRTAEGPSTVPRGETGE